MRSRTDDTPLLAAALDYAARGWEIFPLAGKIPAIPKRNGGNGVLDATTDPERITAWWTTMPWANIGGRVPADLIVIDLDPRHGALDDARVDDLPNTLICWSGRDDDGRHLYYRHPGDPVCARRLPPGWDLKTSAGYAVLPPSTHPATGKPYRWEDPSATAGAPPAWLVQLLRPPVPRPRAAAPFGAGSRPTRYVRALVAGELGAVAGAVEGTRNNTLVRASFRIGQAVAAGHLDEGRARAALEEAARACGLPPREAENTIRSGFAAGVRAPLEVR
jgi:hypothetical protein